MKVWIGQIVEIDGMSSGSGMTEPLRPSRYIAKVVGLGYFYIVYVEDVNGGSKHMVSEHRIIRIISDRIFNVLYGN